MGAPIHGGDAGCCQRETRQQSMSFFSWRHSSVDVTTHTSASLCMSSIILMHIVSTNIKILRNWSRNFRISKYKDKDKQAKQEIHVIWHGKAFVWSLNCTAWPWFEPGPCLRQLLLAPPPQETERVSVHLSQKAKLLPRSFGHLLYFNSFFRLTEMTAN